MNTLMSRIGTLAAAGLVAMGITATASAQTYRMKVDVPFAFFAGESQLPAGSYWVAVQGGPGVMDLLPLQDVSTTRVRIHEGEATRKPSEAVNGSLRFHRYGDTYVLHSLFVNGAMESKDLAHSKVETKLAKSNPAGTAGAVEVVDLSVR